MSQRQSVPADELSGVVDELLSLQVSQRQSVPADELSGVVDELLSLQVSQRQSAPVDELSGVVDERRCRRLTQLADSAEQPVLGETNARLQSSARALINRRAPKSYRSARASIFSACACHTSTFSACALRCYTDISIRFTLCNKETKERVYKIGKGTARGVYNQSLDR